MSRHRIVLAALALFASLAAAAGEKPRGTSGELSQADYRRLNAGFAESGGSDYDTPPRVLKGYNPLYPASRLVARKTGVCVIRFGIGAAGRAERIEAEGGDEKMCDHAVHAFRLWEFAPATKDGQVIGTRHQVPITYDIR